MMSVSAKRPASFSIDSIMRNDRESSASPRKSSSVSPDPAASLGAHLLNMKSLYENHYLAESMGLGMNHPALAGALPSSLPGQIGCLPPHNPSFNSLFLGSAAHRDPLLLNPWMMARRNHLLAQRFGGKSLKYFLNVLGHFGTLFNVGSRSYRNYTRSSTSQHNYPLNPGSYNVEPSTLAIELTHYTSLTSTFICKSFLS